MKKSKTSGFLRRSVGQWVGERVDKMFAFRSWMAVRSSRPLGLMSREAQYVCLALKSPPMMEDWPAAWRIEWNSVESTL